MTDLTEELRKEAFTMDAASEAKVVESILRLLQDSAKEVQDVAVKSLVSTQHNTKHNSKHKTQNKNKTSLLSITNFFSDTTVFFVSL